MYLYVVGRTVVFSFQYVVQILSFLLTYLFIFLSSTDPETIVTPGQRHRDLTDGVSLRLVLILCHSRVRPILPKMGLEEQYIIFTGRIEIRWQLVQKVLSTDLCHD